MSEQRRHRYRKNKNEEKRSFVLAKRPEDPQSGRAFEAPKIILKSRNAETEAESRNEPRTSNDGYSQVKTLIYTRSEALSPSLSREHTEREGREGVGGAREPPQTDTTDAMEPINPLRPITVILSTGVLNPNAKKFLNKTNKDFFVVGVLGMQGVGKSTILNLLATEQSSCDYQKMFVDQDNIFPTRLKQHKFSSRARTESTHMYFTADRMILLDSPPLMCNTYRKEMIADELDELRLIITFFAVCHLVIVVQDDYFNVNLMRLLQLAELMKPVSDGKSFSNDYYPNMLFVKNRAKRLDYEGQRKQLMDKSLSAIFRDSDLRVYLGQTSSGMQRHVRKPRGHNELEPEINSIMFPDIRGAESTSYHKSLQELVQDFRRLVYMTPRNAMYSGAAEFTEAVWYEMLKTVNGDKHLFFDVYNDSVRAHLDGDCGASNSKEIENWRE